MEQSEEIFCRLCLNATNDENSKTIEGNNREIVEFLLSKLKFSEGVKHVLCNTCHTKLLDAYNFKAICMETEDSIFPYVNSKLFDMKEIFFIINGYDPVKSVSEDENVCRLCMQWLSCEFIPLEEVDIDMIHEYIAEVNFKSTKDPVICEMCFKSLIAHSSFLKTCMDTEEQVKCTNDDYVSVKTEELDIKTEENCPNSDPSPNQEGQFITCLQYPSKVQLFKCDKCDFQTLHKRNINTHQIKHIDPSKLKMYKCDDCDFETKYRGSVKKHTLRHKYPSEVQIYKCEKCSFQTKHKSSLTNHQKMHKYTSKMQVNRSEECSCQTKHKCKLPMHQVKQRDTTEVKIYTCYACDYKTKHWRSLKKHSLRHKDPSEVQMYKCDKCSFQTKNKWSLTNHQITHKDTSEGQMYKSGDCTFETKHKQSLNSHRLQRHEPSKVSSICEVDIKMETN